jgi:hypothetical protein
MSGRPGLEGGRVPGGPCAGHCCEERLLWVDSQVVVWKTGWEIV